MVCLMAVVMTERLYTLKEIAGLLNASGTAEEFDRIARQVRHWTLSDLLRPSGRKHTGKGVSRQYEALEVQKAALLRELSRYGMTVTQLEGFDEWIDRLVTMDKWRAGLDGSRAVFLVMMWDREGSASWSLHADQPDLKLIDPLRTPPGKREAGAIPDTDYTSAIVISLNKVLGRLRL